MNTRLIAGVVSFSLAMTGVFLGNMLMTAMIGEINRKRQDGNLVSYFGFTPPKVFDIFSEYRASYPNGKLHIYTWAAAALAATGMLGVAVCLRIVG